MSESSRPRRREPRRPVRRERGEAADVSARSRRRRPQLDDAPRAPRPERGSQPPQATSRFWTWLSTSGPVNLKKRLGVAQVFAILLAVVLIGRLALVQVVWGPEFAAKAEAQRSRLYVDPARRGAIEDRHGHSLASTMQARSLTVSPKQFREEERERQDYKLYEAGGYNDMSEQEREQAIADNVDRQLEKIAQEIPATIKEAGASAEDVKPEDILTKLEADSTYEILVRNVDPDVAAEIVDTFPGIAADYQEIRNYPNGAIAQNVVGKTSMEGEGQFGFELYADENLAGKDGSSKEDVSTNGQAIPGTLRDVVPVQDGASYELTLDLDLQTYVQQQVQQAKDISGAESAQAIVLDARSAEVLAMANSDTIDPNGDIKKQLEEGRSFTNSTISNPFEPGSVAKIITASAAIDNELTTPDEVLSVPGSIDMAGVTVRDAWEHGTVGFTTTGVFAKSSNVGTLMLAQRVGEDRFNDYLHRFGLGEATGVELPGETAGLLPAREDWGGGTFANLPIGQGMAMSLLQMTGIYQTIANDGERIQPRIVKSKTDAEGNEVPIAAPESVQVMKPEAAKVVRNMFQGVVQGADGGQSGTAPDGAIEGYQISGKTGTAQQIDENTGAYSNSDYWITFAGIAPADDPRYVIGIMLDDPERGVHGGGGGTAAPLFKDIAQWLLARDNVPLSPPREGNLVLQAY